MYLQIPIKDDVYDEVILKTAISMGYRTSYIDEEKGVTAPNPLTPEQYVIKQFLKIIEKHYIHRVVTESVEPVRVDAVNTAKSVGITTYTKEDEDKKEITK